jgi:hypothetical protein
LVFTNVAGQTKYLQGSGTGQALTLDTTAGQPTVRVDGTGSGSGWGALCKAAISGTNGFVKLGATDFQIDALSTAAADASPISGTISVNEGMLWVRGLGRMTGVNDIVIKNGATFYIYEINSDNAAIDAAGRVNPAARYRLDGGGRYYMQAANTTSGFAYNEFMGTLRNAVGYSSAAVGTIDFNYANPGGRSLTISNLTHDVGGALNVFNPALTAWDDSTYRITLPNAALASGTPISGATGTSLIPYLRAGNNDASYNSGFVGLTAANNIRLANWNPLGSTYTNWASGDNVLVATGNAVLSNDTGVVTINALRFDGVGYDQNYGLNTQLVIIASGLLSAYNSNVPMSLNGGRILGFNQNTIGPVGSITSGTNELFITTMAGATLSLTLWQNVNIVDNSVGPVNVTKLNTGNLRQYSVGNTYSGRTTIGQGGITLNQYLTSETPGAAGMLGRVPSTFSANNIVMLDGTALGATTYGYLHANRGIGIAGSVKFYETINRSFNIMGPISDYAAGVTGSVTFLVGGGGGGTAFPGGAYILGGASTYSGYTLLQGGMIRLATGGNRLPVTTALTLNGTTTPEFAPILDLAGYNQSLAGLFGGSAAVKGMVTNTASGTATLTLTGASDFDGALGDGGAGSGKYLALVVAATNQTATLRGAGNRIAGAVAVTGGALDLSSNGLLTAGATTFGPSTGLGLTLTPANTAARLAVTGNLDVSGAALTLTGTPAVQTVYTLATYSGTLTQPFASVSGVPSRWFIDYGTGNNSSIRLRPPPVGNAILVR